jgi:tetratricopeptide (TPR) repeat protein
MAMPVTVLARMADGTEQRFRSDRWLETQQFRIAATAPIAAVIVDPDKTLATAEPPSERERIVRSRIRDLPWAGAGNEALPLLEQAQALGIAESDVWRKLAMALFDGRHYSKALEALGRLEPDFFRLVWEGNNLELLGRRAEAIERYKRALELPDKREMTHSQYKLKIDEAWVRERMDKPFMRP